MYVTYNSKILYNLDLVKKLASDELLLLDLKDGDNKTKKKKLQVKNDINPGKRYDLDKIRY